MGFRLTSLATQELSEKDRIKQVDSPISAKTAKPSTFFREPSLNREPSIHSVFFSANWRSTTRNCVALDVIINHICKWFIVFLRLICSRKETFLALGFFFFIFCIFSFFRSHNKNKIKVKILWTEVDLIVTPLEISRFSYESESLDICGSMDNLYLSLFSGSTWRTWPTRFFLAVIFSLYSCLNLYKFSCDWEV